MSVCLTPDGEPFYGGTYFRAAGRGGAGFPRVLKEMGRIWKEERPRVAAAPRRTLTEKIRGDLAARTRRAPGRAAAADARRQRGRADRSPDSTTSSGGFGGAPSSRTRWTFALLLRVVRAATATKAARTRRSSRCEKMAAGGICDQVGGGFHRYSTDERWLVPHFEKMLYDNALLASAYLDAWLAERRRAYARIVRGDRSTTCCAR